MVRLQLKKIKNERMLYLLSQFHYGSITTEKMLYYVVAEHDSLNSTMVRLQLCKLLE